MKPSIVHELYFKLNCLRSFHGASQEFSKKLGLRIQDKAFAKGWFTHLLNDKSFFEGHRSIYLPEALSLADELLAKYRKKTEDEAIISFKVSDLQETITHLDQEFEKGNVDYSLWYYDMLTQKIRSPQVLARNPEVYRNLHFSIAKCLMQRGEAYRDFKPLESINYVLEINQYLPPNPLLYMRMLNLKGHIHRQHSPIKIAIDYYDTLSKEANFFSLGTQKSYWNALLEHQLAITLAHNKSYLKQKDISLKALELLSKSNQYFDDNTDEKWSLFTRIREAEIQLLVGNKDKGGAFLDMLEHRPDLLMRLPLSHQSIYLRANTLRYAVTENKENALKYLSSVQEFNQKHQYLGQLNLIEKYKNELLNQLK